MTPLEILQGARELLTPPENWTKGVLARSGIGGPSVAADDTSAACWCSLGATDKASNGDFEMACRADDLLREALGEEGIGDWNDSSTHAEILAGFDRAIALAKAEALEI